MDAEQQISPVMAATLRDSVIGLLLTGQRHSLTDTIDRTLARLGPLPSVLRKARDYLEAHATEPLDLDRLSRAAGIGIRSLQLGFQKHFGMSISDVLLDIRLTHLNARLLRAAPGERVIDMAFDLGFTHPSRMASVYRARYGESPSDTLRRSRERSLAALCCKSLKSKIYRTGSLESSRKAACMSRLSGSHALVTGGGRGIGRAIAASLAQAGATVTIMGRNLAVLNEVVAAGDAHHAITADVSDQAALNAAIAEAATRQPIDILVANAGAAESAPFVKSDAALFQRMMDVNFMGVVYATQAVLPDMVKRKTRPHRRGRLDGRPQGLRLCQRL